MPGTQETIKRLSLQLSSLPRLKFPQGIHDRLRGLLEDARKEAERVKTNIATIRSSTRFTVEGQQHHIAELVGEVKEDLLGRIPPAIEEFKQAEARLTKLLTTGTKQPEGDPIVTELRAREIRDGLKGKSPMELNLMFTRALESGNDMLAWVLRSSPMPLLSDEIVQKVETQQSQEANPKEFELRNQTRQAISFLSLNWEFITSWLDGLGSKQSSEDRIRRFVSEQRGAA